MSNNFGINKDDKSLLDIYHEIESTTVTPEKKIQPIKDKIVGFDDASLKMKFSASDKGKTPNLFAPSSFSPSERGSRPPTDNQSTLMLELLLRVISDKYVKQGMSLEEAQKQAEKDAVNYVSTAYQEGNLDPSDTKNTPNAVELALAKFFKSEGTSTEEALNQAQAAGIIFSATGPFMSWVNSINAPEGPPPPSPKDALYDAGINATNNALDMLDTIKSTIEGDTTISAEDKHSMINFMNAIGDVINKIKQLLIEIQIQDTQKAGELSQQKQDMSKARFEATAKLLAEQFQQLWDAAHPPMWMKVLKILIPVITVLIAIVVSAATLGAGSPAAAIMSALIITAVMTALSETGVLAKGMQSMMNGIVGLLKDMGCSDSVANILAFFLIMCVTILVGFISPVAASKFASQAVFRMVTAVCIPLALTFALSSGAISNFILGCWLAVGKSKDDPELAKIQMAFAILFAVVAMVFTGRFAPGAGASSVSEKSSDLANWCGKHSTQLKGAAAVLQMGAGGMNFAVNYVQFESLQRQGKMALSIAELEAIVTLLNMMVTQLQNTIDEMLTHGSEKGKEAANINTSWENLLSNMQASINQLFAA